jgi:hypothetical protein
MAIAVSVLNKAPSLPPPNREDLVLLMVAAAMPEALNRAIVNPVVEGETLDEGWTQEKRADFIGRALALGSCLTAATGGNSPDAAIVRMQDCFGDRIPDQPSLVQPDDEAAMLSTPRQYVAAPAVGRSVSG